jgi:putative endonuclease
MTFEIAAVKQLPTTYIMASSKRGALYIGVTSNLIERLDQHRAGMLGGFTHDRATRRLVRFETFADMGDAIVREKTITRKNLLEVYALIEQGNPEWNDLAEKLGFDAL